MAKKMIEKKKKRVSFFIAFKDKKPIILNIFAQTFFIFIFAIFTLFILVKITDPLIYLSTYFGSGNENLSMLDAYKEIKIVGGFLFTWFIGLMVYLLFFEAILWYQAKRIFVKANFPIRRFILTYVIIFLIFLIPISIIFFVSLKSLAIDFLNEEAMKGSYFIPILIICLLAYFLMVSLPNISRKGFKESIKKIFINGIVKLPFYIFIILSILLVMLLFVVMLVQINIFIVPLLLVGLILCLFFYRLVMVYLSEH